MYNPATDFAALWRNNGDGTVSSERMPGLDFTIAALARAGVITLSVSATAPVANQATTAWLQTAVPSYSGEGTFQLWNGNAYAPATPALFWEYLNACAGASGASWWPTTGGPPSNTVGNNGDYAIRTDGPGGVYGPKAAGAWPNVALPGTTNTLESASLDNTFGTVEGTMIYRGPTLWGGLPIGSDNQLLISFGGIPEWSPLNALLDALYGSARGSILFRSAAGWNALAPSTDGFVLTTHGPGNDPNWTTKTAEFPSNTVMLFQQTAAPPGWTKQVAIDNVGLRVVAGSVATTPGTPMSAIFSQSAVGNTTITAAQMPSHSHSFFPNTVPNSSSTGSGLGGGGSFGPPTNVSVGTAGNDQPHTHSINLSLAYTDVIIATKN